eukprot:8157835-Alexandrium_andersonii.AAC.1
MTIWALFSRDASAVTSVTSDHRRWPIPCTSLPPPPGLVRPPRTLPVTAVTSDQAPGRPLVTAVT